MKKLFLMSLSVLTLMFMVASCSFGGGDEEPSYDSALLIGKWQENSAKTLYYVYNSDGTGHTWDTSDDVSESEAQEFTWTLIKADLVQIHIMTGGQKVPKQYTVTLLTSKSLSYKDNYNKSFSFTKM